MEKIQENIIKPYLAILKRIIHSFNICDHVYKWPSDVTPGMKISLMVKEINWCNIFIIQMTKCMIILTGAQNHFTKSIHNKNLQQPSDGRKLSVPDKKQNGKTCS